MEKSGHLYAEFLSRINGQKEFAVVENRDITPNVLPTLACAEHFGNAIGVPLMEFVEEKLRVKRPRLHYLLRDVIAHLHSSMDSAMSTVSPAKFQDTKEYRLLVLQKGSGHNGCNGAVIGI